MIDIALFTTAISDTLYMTFVSLLLSVVFGMMIGITLYLTKSDGLLSNKYVSVVIDFIINVLRSIPFIILLIILMPVSNALTGSILGATAAIPSLVFAASPFYARLVVIALNEVDRGVIEAAQSMGANTRDIICRVVLKEAMPSLISAIGVCAISLISYTAMAGAIGSGGLGNLAYMYGFARYNPVVLYLATISIVVIVFAIQSLNDVIVKKIDKR